MPQPKQSATPSTPAVRGDATATPAPATAPAKSTEAAVADVASSEQAAARETAPAAPKPAARKPAARKPAARKPAARKPAAKKPAAAKASATAAKPAAATASAKKPAAKKPAAKKPAAKKPAATRSSTAAKPTAAKRSTTKASSARKPASRTAAAAKPAATKPAAARPKAAPAGRAAAPKPRRAAASSRPARKPAAAPEPTSAAARDEALRANLASLRDLLAGGVVLTAQRLQEAVDEAVTRGRITRRDAEELAGAMLNAGRQQTADLVADVEQLLGRGRSDLTSAGSVTKEAVKDSGDRMLREVDRARRTAGLGSSFPILGYDDLKAKQIIKRLGDLSPAELRKVRDHERSNGERSSILKAVRKALK